MNSKNTEKPPFWMGLLVIGLGALPIIAGAEPTSGTPIWVLYAACSTFILAGVIIIFPILSAFLGPTIILIFALVFSWVGFSPDAKGCTSSVSFGFLTKTKSSGCGAFGFGAVLIWIAFICIVIHSIKKFFRKIKGDDK